MRLRSIAASAAIERVINLSRAGFHARQILCVVRQLASQAVLHDIWRICRGIFPQFGQVLLVRGLVRAQTHAHHEEFITIPGVTLVEDDIDRLRAAFRQDATRGSNAELFRRRCLDLVGNRIKINVCQLDLSVKFILHFGKDNCFIRRDTE